MSVAKTRTDREYAEWLAMVAELLAAPDDVEFPRDPVALELRRTFGCVVSWNWRDPDGHFGFSLLGTIEGFPTPEHEEFWGRHGLDWHPLLRWFDHSGDPTATTVGRVPRPLVPAGCFGILDELLAPYGFEQQLSIPYRLEGAYHRAYVLAQGSEDFPDEAVDLARRLQPLLELLERQREILRSRVAAPSETGLTGRELSVLALLAEGRTAASMAARLGVSPRTVHKHLQNLYRKLGVSDRLGAVMVATEAGALRRGSAGPDAGQHSRPAEQFSGQVVYSRRGDGVDPLEQLVDAHEPALEQLGLTKSGHPGGGLL